MNTNPKENSKNNHIICKGCQSCQTRKNNFECFSTKTIDSKTLTENGGYHHVTKNMKLFIKKGDVSIVLNEDEIKQLANSIGANFKC